MSNNQSMLTFAENKRGIEPKKMLRTPDIIIDEYVDNINSGKKYPEDKTQSRLHKGKKMLSSLIKFIQENTESFNANFT